MDVDQNRINELVARPAESLNIELKRWISPSQPDGEAKIARASLALRNRNGGFLIIGFDDRSLTPDEEGRPEDVRAVFTVDIIQAIVTRYASEAFEIGLGFGVRDGREYPVIAVPEGVTAPVASRRDLAGSDRTTLIRQDDVYFRTLNSNGTPSSSKARARDWREIVEICFDNREADIGRFLRRQIGPATSSSLLQALAELTSAEPLRGPAEMLRVRSEEAITEGDAYLIQAIDRRPDAGEIRQFMRGKGTWTVSLAISPQREDALPTTQFLNVLAAANPNLTGWPVWLDSRGFSNPNSRPWVSAGIWQALIASLDNDRPHFDAISLDPSGKFYHKRVLDDDVAGDRVAPNTVFDPIIAIIRTAEAIAVGLSIARALDWAADAHLGFTFRWEGLEGRHLHSWAKPLVLVSGDGLAADNEVRSYIEVSADTPLAAIAPYVEAATRRLFVTFGGKQIPSNVFEHWVQRLIERKL